MQTKIKFVIDQKLVDSPEQAKHIFKLSEKTKIAYDKPEFMKIFNNMPKEIRDKQVAYIQMMGADNKKIRADGIVEFFGINTNSIDIDSIYVNNEKQLIIPLKGENVGDKLLININNNKIGLQRKGMFNDIGLSWGNNPNKSITDESIINKIRNAINGEKEVEKSVPGI